MTFREWMQRHRRKGPPLALLFGLLLVAFLLRAQITEWFHSHPTDRPAVTNQALDELREALHAYEEIRARLAQDTTTGLEPHAQQAADSLEAAAAMIGERAPDLSRAARSGVHAAHSLASSTHLAEARAGFSALSEAIVALGVEEPQLREGWYLFSCPMVEGFNRWIQKAEAIENPYMGSRMLQCGSVEVWAEPAREAPRAHEHDPGEISHYTCSMHPSVQAEEAGTCPICGMQLVPVTREEVETGVLFIDEERRQKIGVRTGTVTRRPVSMTVRTVGQIDYDERRIVDVNLKVSGWIVRLHVDETGQRVEKGETLFTLYSPELYAAQEEYLQALQSQRAARETGAPGRVDYLVQAAEKRLRLWDLTAAQIRNIARQGSPLEAIPIVSPASGYVTEKNFVEGASADAGTRLYRIAELESVWVTAQIYEMDLGLIRVGQTASVTLPYHPARSFDGSVAYVYPYLDRGTRTGRVRIELENPQLELRPDMFANVEFHVDLGSRLVIPDSAVVFTGPRRLVFRDLGEGRLQPQEVKIGARADDFYEVVAGLSEGDRIVTSGNFLISAESRIRSATRYWGGEDAHTH
jgi:Cu(I)/Ag(I) efflux system membrane fusion protein